ncbi:hypothetical protein Taro_049167 [Colocasia esculenta]|uniref:Uncharacterized protein n=1 Tax=Colocasia esculenta TaxID=4460 RepID=A0A843XA61_COLES|nr:hypothetical protein [Colocasia esculenta]
MASVSRVLLHKDLGLQQPRHGFHGRNSCAATAAVRRVALALHHGPFGFARCCYRAVTCILDSRGRFEEYAFTVQWQKLEFRDRCLLTFIRYAGTKTYGILNFRNRQFICKAEENIPGDVPISATGKMSQYERIVELLTTLFPVWVILGTIIGIYKPSAVTWLETDLFTVGLGFLMLSMGLTLTFEDFRRCMQNPWTVGVGFLAQYMIKPLLGFLIAMTLKLPAPLATGLILVSCCPGGQASNVATYISKGNVALSVLMTT